VLAAPDPCWADPDPRWRSDHGPLDPGTGTDGDGVAAGDVADGDGLEEARAVGVGEWAGRGVRELWAEGAGLADRVGAGDHGGLGDPAGAGTEDEGLGVRVGLASGRTGPVDAVTGRTTM
jgi:hypothetical protein